MSCCRDEELDEGILNKQGLLLLSDADVRALFTPAVAIAAVEKAFRAQGEGKSVLPQSLAFPVSGGGFHVKAALQLGERPVFASKVNGNFPGNPEHHGLPTIQGAVFLADAERGTPLALIASGWLTAMRTAAASAVAAKHLSEGAVTTAAIIGCGVQGRTHLPMLRHVRGLKEIRLFDTDARLAERLAGEMREEVGIRFIASPTVPDAVRGAGIVVTCTTSTLPILTAGDVAPGTFIAAVGADAPHKWEIAPSLMGASAVVCDLASQCAEIGDLHHAIAAGTMTHAEVRAELGEVVAGRKTGRRSADEIVVFDSTGTALLDVAAALGIHDAAIHAGRGTTFDLSGT